MLQKAGSSGNLTKTNSGGTLTRTISGSSLGSDPSSHEKRLSVTKADNVTVSFVGGKPKPRHGALRIKRSSIFASFKQSYVSVDNGEISFAENELDVNKRETYSLLDVREVKLAAPGSNQFVLRLGQTTATKGAGKVVNLKAETPKEASDWISSIHHELRNQVLVCKQNVKTLEAAGKIDRCEPFFRQRLDLLRVITDGNDDGDTADALDDFSEWCESQGRQDESATMKKQAKAIRRRVATSERPASTEYSSCEPDDFAAGRITPPGHPPLPPGSSSPVPSKGTSSLHS